MKPWRRRLGEGREERERSLEQRIKGYLTVKMMVEIEAPSFRDTVEEINGEANEKHMDRRKEEI